MDFEQKYSEIRNLIAKEDTDSALDAIEKILSEDKNQEMAYYLRGNIFRKRQNWRLAIDNYTQAIELNPNSAALGARKMCLEILNFYDTNLWNH